MTFALATFALALAFLTFAFALSLALPLASLAFSFAFFSLAFALSSLDLAVVQAGSSPAGGVGVTVVVRVPLNRNDWSGAVWPLRHALRVVKVGHEGEMPPPGFRQTAREPDCSSFSAQNHCCGSPKLPPARTAWTPSQ